MTKYIGLAMLTILAGAGIAFADEGDGDSCNRSCPSGQVSVSFADGDHCTAQCADSAPMDETPPEPGGNPGGTEGGDPDPGNV